jgi:hypothetical protein
MHAHNKSFWCLYVVCTHSSIFVVPSIYRTYSTYSTLYYWVTVKIHKKILGKQKSNTHTLAPWKFFISHRKLANFFYHTECHTCFKIAPNSTTSHSHGNCFPSITRWLLPITPIPKESVFARALVVVNSRTYHTTDKNPFIMSHVCGGGGTWRMTLSSCIHCKYHTWSWSPVKISHLSLFTIILSLTKRTKYNFCDVFYATVGFAQNRDSVAMVTNPPYTDQYNLSRRRRISSSSRLCLVTLRLRLSTHRRITTGCVVVAIADAQTLLPSMRRRLCRHCDCDCRPRRLSPSSLVINLVLLSSSSSLSYHIAPLPSSLMSSYAAPL